MITRKPRKVNRHDHPLGDAPADRTYRYEFQISERKVARSGMEVKVRNRRGDFIFLRHTILNDGREWIDLIGPHGTGWVSVRPDEITKLAPIKRGRN